MQNLFTIGEIANIFYETRETFRHYDRVGLLKPHIIKDNGYRYYSLDQFEIIRTILYLRSIGTSVDHIKTILHTDSSKAIIDEIKSQKKRLKEEINHLKHLEKQTAAYLNKLKEFDTSIIKLSSEPDFYVIEQNFDTSHLAIDPQKAISLHYNISSEWIKQANIISIVDKEKLASKAFHDYIGYGLISELKCKTKNPFYHLLSSQNYVTTCVQVRTFEHSEIDSIYDDMLSYINEHNLTITGNAFERNFLDLYNKNSPGDIHYLKLYIPVH